jgi:hypothetical protein
MQRWFVSRPWALAFACCFSVGCAGKGSIGTEQDAGRCPDLAEVLTGSGLYNEPCTTYADCAPSCCICNIGSSVQTYLASECAQGACADLATACQDAENSTLCP